MEKKKSLKNESLACLKTKKLEDEERWRRKEKEKEEEEEEEEEEWLLLFITDKALYSIFFSSNAQRNGDHDDRQTYTEREGESQSMSQNYEPN